MLAKGHDFPKVELGVILNCDAGITSPDINSLEKISQLCSFKFLGVSEERMEMVKF